MFILLSGEQQIFSNLQHALGFPPPTAQEHPQLPSGPRVSIAFSEVLNLWGVLVSRRGGPALCAVLQQES